MTLAFPLDSSSLHHHPDLKLLQSVFLNVKCFTLIKSSLVLFWGGALQGQVDDTDLAVALLTTPRIVHQPIVAAQMNGHAFS